MFDNLKGMRVAIVGGAGFIGHNLALKLKDLGAEPHILDSLQVNNLGAFSSGMSSGPNRDLYVSFINDRLAYFRDMDIPLHIVDVRDYQLLSPHLNAIEADAVVHLAAVAHANRSNKDPYNTFDHSMRTLENALDTVRDQKPHFIYFSSSMVYGNFNGASVTEEAPCEPIGIYAALKLSGEKLVIAYNQVFDVPYTIIRPSALYGERCVSRRVGQAFIENACRGVNLTINGDGTDALDFTYIQDLIQGVIRCLGNEKAYGEVFNMTYGQARTIRELADLVLTRFPDIKISMNPRDNLMPERGTLSVDKARDILGYAPEFPIEKGFNAYIDWYEQLLKQKPELF